MERIISVGKITAYLRNLITTDPGLMNVNVKGEASNVTYHSSGHLYFTCKDQEAQMPCVMWQSKVKTGMDFRLKNGDAVVVSGNVDLYAPSGKYQLMAQKIRLYGQGDIYAEYQRLKKELTERGMTAEAYKQPLPSVVRRIGVVTSENGRAITDILAVLKDHPCVETVLLMPCAVEGESSAVSVAEGICRIREWEPDVIIVGRGGGSYESFGAYNTEIVAQAVFDCEVPVISAVGHEDDWVITDLVADLRATTPTKAAEMIVANWEASHRRLDAFSDVLNADLDHLLDAYRHSLHILEEKVRRLDPKERLREVKTRLELIGKRLDLVCDRRLADKRSALVLLEERMEQGMDRILEKKQRDLQFCAAKLDALSPLKRLASGYVFLQNDAGEPLKSVSGIREEDILQLRLQDGSVKARVLEVAQKL